MIRRFTEKSPHLNARLAGIFYSFNIATSLIAFSGSRGHWLTILAGLVATVCYVAVTILLYYLFRPVNRTVSLLAAFFSLTGCAIGVLNSRHLLPFHVHPLVFFGFYCLTVGYLILRSTFLPRILGALMVIAGVGWLTFISPPLANYLSPYHYAAGGIGEGLLTVWLLAAGVNVPRWREQASGSTAAAPSSPPKLHPPPQIPR